MKIYEKPLVDVKTFDVEDVMTASGVFAENNETIAEIMGTGTYEGVAFEW